MPTLLPCPSCNRHVRSADTVCPFCEETMSLAGPQRITPAKRIVQAAVLAGSLAGASACSGGTDDKIDGGQQASIDADPNQPDADPNVADATPVADADPNQPDAFPQMPYGAPPARRRLV
jgi:hypothetical protein